MSVKLKPLDQQVLVITGASSGIGLATARMAARRGAAVVLVSRNEAALRQIQRELHDQGRRAVYAVADVGDEAQVRQVVEVAVTHFGGFDTWVNNAGVTTYGRIEQVPVEDHRRVFETNFWGLVYGSMEAARHFRQRTRNARHGAALINIGSALSDRPIPLQGMYSASKHAVKGFTDALRMELEEEGLAVSVTTIKPAAIDTMYIEHARNYLPHEPRNPAPVYAPQTVAHAILHAATHPQRDIYVGAAAKAFSLMNKYMPRLSDYYMERALFTQQQTDEPPKGPRRGLFEPGEPLRERGHYSRIGHVAESSLYTRASLHPVLTSAVVAAGLATVAWLSWRGRD